MSAAQQMMGCDGCDKVQNNEGTMQTYILKDDARCFVANILHDAYCKLLAASNPRQCQ